MFDELFNYIIFLIPAAILIGRFVSRAKAKNAPPPKKPPQPHIPVHFEDEKDDDFTAYFRNRNRDTDDLPAPPQKAPLRKTPSPARTQKTVASPFTPKPEMPSFAAKPPVAPVRNVAAMHEKKDFVFNLNHLSPLKQAVVMAEILGQPKGMM